MGTWGTGNFDSDTAADHLGILVARLIEEIATAMAGDPVELEWDQYWGVAVPCNLELLALLHEERWVGVDVPEPATVAAWRTRYLAIWDAGTSSMGASPQWTRARRAVLVATFDQLEKLSQREADSRAAKPGKPKQITQRRRPIKIAKPRRTRR